MKRYRVTLRFEREFTRIVKARTESQAIKLAQSNIHKKKIPLRAKDMDKQTVQVDSE